MKKSGSKKCIIIVMVGAIVTWLVMAIKKRLK